MDLHGQDGVIGYLSLNKKEILPQFHGKDLQWIRQIDK
jgi:hypothetical protein